MGEDRGQEGHITERAYMDFLIIITRMNIGVIQSRAESSPDSSHIPRGVYTGKPPRRL